MISTLLVDYGEVICLPQPEWTLREMAQLCGFDVDTFTSRYWEHRPIYDGGSAARDYWARVIGSRTLDDDRLGRLIEVDMQSWSELNPETLAVLEHARTDGGAALALLSNAPHELASMLESLPALSGFEALFFSARLGLVKPDQTVYEAVAQALGRRPAEILLIDDRPANVEAAQRFGMGAIRFTDAAALRAELKPRLGRD